MTTLAIMAVLAILGTAISSAVTANEGSLDREQQEKLLKQEQDFQASREDIAYERQRPANRYNDLLELGVNPTIAMSSILGGNTDSPISGSSPSAPNVPSVANPLAQILGQGSQNLQDLFKNQAEIENIQSQTNLNDINAGIIPKDYNLRELSTTEQIKLWTSEAEKNAKIAGYNEEMTNLVKEQNLYYGRLSEVQIKAYEAQVNEATAKAAAAWKSIEVMDKDIDVKDSEILLNQANAGKAVAETGLIDQETLTEEQRTSREKIANQFETDLGGIPLTADAQKMVQKMVNDGDFEGVQKFFKTVFNTRLAEGRANRQVESGYIHYPGGKVPASGLFRRFGMSPEKVENFNYMYHWNP